MVRKLGAYLVEMRRAGRSLERVEASFSVDLPVPINGTERQAQLRGQVDRLEVDQDGRFFIVDLKTGKSAPTDAEVPQHPQLASYQVAAAEGGFNRHSHSDTGTGTGTDTGTGEAGAGVGNFGDTGLFSGQRLGGAALVHLGTTAKSPRIQDQPALLAGETWAYEMIQQAAVLMAGAEFEAVHDPKRSGYGAGSCRLPEICPLCPEGKQVTE